MPPHLDLTNQRFGQLVAQQWLPGLYLGRGKSLTWLCRCDCGQTVPISRDALRGGYARRCPTCQAVGNAQASQQKQIGANMQREPLRRAEPPPEPSLQQRIADALKHKRVTSDTLSAVFNQAADALLDAEQEVKAIQARVLDPANLDPGERSALDAAIYQRDKLQRAVSALRTRHQQILAQERQAQWNADADAIETRRDDLTEEFAQRYPDLIAGLIELFARVKDMDAEVDQINGSAPDSEGRRLLPTGIRPDLSVNTKLLGLSGQLVWPPPIPAILPEQIMPVLPHAGSHWFEGIAQRDQQRHADAVRVAEYHNRMAREREQREAAETRTARHQGNGASR